MCLVLLNHPKLKNAGVYEISDSVKVVRLINLTTTIQLMSSLVSKHMRTSWVSVTESNIYPPQNGGYFAIGQESLFYQISKAILLAIQYLILKHCFPSQ